MEEKEDNIDVIMDMMKDSYNQNYQRMQSVDNKSGFLIAFHSAIIVFLVDFQNLQELLGTQYYSIREIIIPIIQIVSYFIIFILAILSICLFIWELKSRNIKCFKTTICDSKYYKCDTISLKKELLNKYREINENNEIIIEKKHNIYNIASNITVMEVILLGINILLKICN